AINAATIVSVAVGPIFVPSRSLGSSRTVPTSRTAISVRKRIGQFAVPMRTRRLEVSVTFDERRGYVATAPELRAPVVALSLSSLRRRVEVALLRDGVELDLVLDALAKRERDRRRQQTTQMAR